MRARHTTHGTSCHSNGRHKHVWNFKPFAAARIKIRNYRPRELAILPPQFGFEVTFQALKDHFVLKLWSSTGRD
jgi:hypothetical protein